MLASSGGEVRLYDPNADQLEVARRYVEAELPRVVAGRSGALPGRLILSKTVQAAVADTWMVVEAIPERLDPKIKMFGDLDRLAPEDAILASNSSSYPTSQFIDAVSRPGRVVNTHYYRPPELNVVEVMSSGKTTDEVIARQLGVSLRTIRRRIQAMMHTASAQNRAQLGWHAARNNWL